MEKRKKFFDEISKKWDELNYTPEEKLRRVIEEAKLRKGNVVLDVGSGTGILIPFILEKVGVKGKVYAIDYSSEMIKRIKEKNFPENVIPVLEDIHQTTFPDNFFDRIIANACFPHFSNKKKAILEIYRILKKGGIFVISHPDGREKVNVHHRKVHPSVKDDVVPTIYVLRKFLENLNFHFIKGIDEDEFYLTSFYK